MKYPMLYTWMHFARKGEDYEVTDSLLGEDGGVFIMGDIAAHFAAQLDGKTDPYTIDRRLTHADVDELLDDLDDCEILRHSRVLEHSLGNIMYTVWMPSWNRSSRCAAAVYNALLLALWLPVLLLGVWIFCGSLGRIEVDYSLWGNLLGMLAGIALHELGHAMAGAGYGAQVYELGVMVQNCMPGAYTLMSIAPVKKRLQRIQIDAAGIETNLLLTGLFLALCVLCPGGGAVFFSAGICNAMLAVLNGMLLKGLDGFAIMSEILGIEDLAQKSKQVVLSKKRRRALRRQGLPGRAAMAACYLLFGIQLAFPTLMLLNLIEVISWLF